MSYCIMMYMAMRFCQCELLQCSCDLPIKHDLVLQVFEGYADDPRNTDNAWIETTAFNYHDEDGSLTNHLKLQVSHTDFVHVSRYSQ